MAISGKSHVGSPVGAAGFSFAAFASGAAVPILPFLVTSGTAAVAVAAAVGGVALFATGATVGVLTRRATAAGYLSSTAGCRWSCRATMKASARGAGGDHATTLGHCTRWPVPRMRLASRAPFCVPPMRSRSC